MPRKKKATTASAAGASEIQAAANGASGKPGNKTEAVRQALGQGVTSPTKISEWARAEHGIEISPDHVSVIKGNLKRKAGGGNKKGKGGRKPGRQAAAATPAVTSAARSTRTA